MAKKTNNKQSKKNNKAEDVIIGINNKKRKVVKKNKKNKKKEIYHKIVLAVIKWIILIALLIGSVLFFLSTPLFNIEEITVLNNSKISTDTINELAGLKLGENIYKLSKSQIEKNIKTNPYIESVKIKRKLPSKVEITVQERQATYVLEIGNGFMAINNQGYMLEIEQEEKGLPVLTGISTKVENIIEGQRIVEEDLGRLEIVLKIMDSISLNGITEKVTEIDISNKQDYKLTFEEEGKIAHLGDASEISTRVWRLKAILQQEKGKNGEIFINGEIRKKQFILQGKTIINERRIFSMIKERKQIAITLRNYGYVINMWNSNSIKYN